MGTSILSLAEKHQQQAEWDGVCLLGICAGALSYNWMAEAGLYPEVVRAWVASLTVFPWALVSLVQLADIEDRTSWMEHEIDLEAVSADSSAPGARAA